MMFMASAKIQHQLSPEAASVSQARHLLYELDGMVSTDMLERLRLLVSELMTNAVEHAGLTEDERIGLLVSVRDRLIRVEVHDGGLGFEKMPSEEPPPLEQLAGRGLYLVEILSDHWGVEPDNMVCVWFEITDYGGWPSKGRGYWPTNRARKRG